MFMKKLFLILPIMIFILGCSLEPQKTLSLKVSMHDAESRAIDSEDIIKIEKVELWILPEGFKNAYDQESYPIMNPDPDRNFFKTPVTESYSREQLELGYIEFEVQVETIVNIWLRVDTNIDKVYIGAKKLYVSPNTSVVKVDVTETPLSELDSFLKKLEL